MRVISRLFWALVFFTLFAFALNNQQLATVRFFFGLDWQGPMVFVVLVAFGAGCALGVIAMAPHWWRQKREVRREVKRLAPAAAPGTAPKPVGKPSGFGTGTGPSTGLAIDHPPREGL